MPKKYSLKFSRFCAQFATPSKAALQWFLFGLDVIPVVPGTKKPAVKWDWWRARLSPTSIRAYWSRHPDHEVGFIVGDYYIVFDADSPKQLSHCMRQKSDSV